MSNLALYLYWRWTQWRAGTLPWAAIEATVAAIKGGACPACGATMRPHPEAFVWLCPVCGEWTDGHGHPIPPPRLEDVRVPAGVREILEQLP